MKLKQIALATMILGSAIAVGAQETTLFFAASARTQGANETSWVTDARVFNPDSSETITVRLSFLESNTDNTGAEEFEISVAPRQAAALDDLVGNIFGRSGTGGVRLHSSSPFLATSRTFNTGDGSSGTFGQFIPGMAPAAALEEGILLQVSNDPSPTGSRSNLGFVNPGLGAVVVSYRVFDATSDTLLGAGTWELPPLAYHQINNVFNAIGRGGSVVGNATIEFSAPTPVLVYASVVDNTSGDAIFVQPSADSGTPGGGNSHPVGVIRSPGTEITVAVGEAVEFVATVSDPDGDDVTGLWDFGDGSTEPGLSVSHSFATAGVYTVTFTATDEHGLSDPFPDTRTVTVE